MIVDRLERWEQYVGISPGLEIGLRFLVDLDTSGFDEKTVEVDGKNVYAMCQVYETEGEQDRFYEAHREYIDIQMVVSGSELLRVSDVSGLKISTPYTHDGDFELYDLVPGIDLHLGPGQFAVFFPHDAHVPKLQSGEPSLIQKVVVKVRVNP